MLFNLLVGLSMLAVVVTREAELEALVMKGYFEHDLKLLHEFYIPSGQCSGLIIDDFLYDPECVTKKNSAVLVSVRDWPNYASVHIEDTLDEVTIRRRQFNKCSGKALVRLEVQCEGFTDRSKRSVSQNAVRLRLPRALPSIPLLEQL